MLADRIIVDTKSCLPDEAGVCVTIYGWQGFAAASPSKRTHHGTSIRMLLKPDVAAQLTRVENLASEIAKQVPLLEFSAFVRREEVRIELPQITTARSARQTSFALGADGSRVILRVRDLTDMLHTEWTSPCSADASTLAVCQDGIAVAGMRAPSSEHAMTRVLREMGLLLDLRGKSRVGLDLSRNLVEGDLEAFWNERTQAVWDAIAAVVETDRIARIALTQLVEAVVTHPKSPPYFLIRAQRLSTDYAELDAIDEIWIADSNVPQRVSHLGERVLWLCPPAPHTITAALSLEPDVPQFEGYYVDDETNQLNDDLAPEAEIGDVPQERSRTRAPRRMSETAKMRTFLSNVRAHWAQICTRFPWVTHGDDGLRFTRTSRVGARSVSDLLGFALTDTWRIVFDLDTGVPGILPAHGFADLADLAVNKKLSYGDLLMALSFGTEADANTERRVDSALRESLINARGEFIARQPELDSEDEYDEREQERDQQSREWQSISALIYFPEEDAKHYRGLAKRFGLLKHVPPWEGFGMSPRAF